MHPQEASSLAAGIAELFKGIAPAERELLQTILQRFDYAAADTVISRYSQETANFDRGKLVTLLREEHSRRIPRVSATAQWKDAKEAEARTIDEFLKKIPEKELQGLVEIVRRDRPDVFGLLRCDPLQTDIGKSLIYAELKQRNDAKPLARPA